MLATKSTEDATKFYNSKVDELGANLKDLESIVQGKSNNLRVVEDGEWNFVFFVQSKDIAN